MKYKAILIDDQIKYLDALKNKWSIVFNLAGMDVLIQTTTEFELSEEQLNERPHFIIADNILELNIEGKTLPKEVPRGIDLIAKHKPDHPDTVFILSTNFTFSIDVLGQKTPNPDLIVPKTALSSDNYKRNLACLIKASIHRTPFGRLNIPNPEDGSKVEEFRESLVSIIEQCIYPLTGIQIETEIKQINITGLTGGFSGSQVYSVQAFDDSNRGKVPLVLKISKGSGAYREVAAYNSFVRLNIPHDMRVDLIGCGESGGYKGALYAFAFGDSPDLCSLSSQLSGGDYQPLENVVDRFFAAPEIGWYNRIVAHKNAEEFYSNSEEYSLEKDSTRLDTLKSYAIELLGEKKVEVGLESLKLGKFSFSFIRKKLEEFSKYPVPECICHGDFNTNNLIFGRSNQSIATIDFEYSGVDIVFKDFISLECSVRIDDIRQPISNIKEFNTRVDQELQLLMEKTIRSKSLPDYFSGLTILRTAAKSCVARSEIDFEPRLYALALSFHLLKLLGISALSKNSKAQLLAAFTAAGMFLNKK